MRPVPLKRAFSAPLALHVGLERVQQFRCLALGSLFDQGIHSNSKFARATCATSGPIPDDALGPELMRICPRRGSRIVSSELVSNCRARWEAAARLRKTQVAVSRPPVRSRYAPS